MLNKDLPPWARDWLLNKFLKNFRGHLAHVLERHVHLHVRHRLKWSSLLIQWRTVHVLHVSMKSRWLTWRWHKRALAKTLGGGGLVGFGAFLDLWMVGEGSLWTLMRGMGRIGWRRHHIASLHILRATAKLWTTLKLSSRGRCTVVEIGPAMETNGTCYKRNSNKNSNKT